MAVPLVPRASSSGTAAPNSASGFLATLIPNILIAVAFFTFFILFRVKYRRIYEPRTYLPKLRPNNRTPATNSTRFGWISDFIHLPDSYVLNHQSIDGYLWLRFFRTLVVICVLGWPLTWVVLMPVYATSHGTSQQFDKISFSNIVAKVDGNRLYATNFVAWVFFGLVMAIIGRESIHYVQVKQALMQLPGMATRLSTRTVLFTNVPTEFINEAKLRETFTSIRHVWLPTDTEALDELVSDRDSTALKLEGGEVKLSKNAIKKRMKAEKKSGKQESTEDVTRWLDPKDRPTHRLGKFGLYGKKVDTIDWSRSHLAELKPKVESERETHLTGKGKFNSAVFVEFDSVQAAQAAFYQTQGKLPKGFVPRTVGTKPSEIIWKNLNMGNSQRRTGTIIASLVIFAMIIFWIPITAFIGAVSNVNNLIQIAPWLSWINKLGPVVGIITGLLPVIALAVALALVPIIMRLLFKKAGAVTIAEVELKTQTWYFVFQVIQVFIVPTAVSGAVASVGNIIKNPSSAPTLLANGLPKASNFYINYIVLFGLAGSAKAFANVVGLILFLVLGALLDGTPRKKYNRFLSLSGIGWGSAYPVYTNIGSIIIIYSCIAPLILGFAAIGFGLIYIAFRYMMFYSQDTLAIDTNGAAFAKAIRQLSTGVYIGEVCLIGLFAIATSGQTAAAGPLALMIVFLVITALYQTFLDHTIKQMQKNVANDGGAAAGGFLVKLLHPPAVPAFDPWLSTPLPEYADETRREAYLNPAIWKPTPILWIAHDDLGISTREKLESGKVIEISDSAAWFDEKGKVTTILSQESEKGEESNRATETPIWEDPIYY